jgi:hypothetical protein
MRQMRSVFKHALALAQCFPHDAELPEIELRHRLLQVTNSAMRELRRGARRRPAEIAGIEQDCVESPELRIQGATRARGSAANHAHIERLRLDVAQDFRTGLHAWQFQCSAGAVARER